MEAMWYGKICACSELTSKNMEAHEEDTTIDAELVLMGWERFCDELESLLNTSQRRLGHANTRACI